MGAEISETLQEGEKARSLQAPNREDTWSKSQQKREIAMSGPRFEHTIFELQVCKHQEGRPIELREMKEEELEDVERHWLFSGKDGDEGMEGGGGEAQQHKQEAAGDERIYP